MSSVTTTTADEFTSTTTASSFISTTSSVVTTTPATTSNVASTTTTLAPSTSIITAEPSTSYAPASTSLVPTTVITQVTSVVTYSNPDQSTQGPIITTITSTQPVVTYTPTTYSASGTSSSSSSSAGASQSALSPASKASTGGGLSNGATIAIAVIIPIIAVIGFVLFGLWFWRRRKAKNQAEEMRKNDMAEYTFNPNNDPTLPVGVGAYGDGGSEGNDDSGYRGWGTTSSANRKPSTTLGSNSRHAAGQGFSDSGSQPGGYNAQPSPSAGGASEDPLVHGYDGLVAAGAVGAAAGAVAPGPRSRHSAVSSGINRGVSNASSAYSGRIAPSEASSEAPDMPRPYYQEEVPYNVYESAPNHGPYADGTYGNVGDEPVIRDVQARRNTRIERAPTFPQQGGIAQNF